MSLICWENEVLSNSIHRFTIGIVFLLQCVSKDAYCVCSPSSSEVRVFPDDLWIYVVVDVDSVWSCAIWSVFSHGAISVGYLCLRHLYYRVFRVRSDVSLFFRFFFLLYDRVCSAQHVYCSSISVFLFRDPTLHRSELYPPFGPSFLDQSLLFSLLAVTSNLGSVASTQLMYSFQSPSHVFGLLAQFGAACAMAFYVFYPKESKKQKEESKSVSSSPRKNETLRLSLCFLAQFLVQL